MSKFTKVYDTKSLIDNHWHTINVINDNIRAGRVKQPILNQQFMTAAEHARYVELEHAPIRWKSAAKRHELARLARKWKNFRDLSRYRHTDNAVATAQHTHIYYWLMTIRAVEGAGFIKPPPCERAHLHNIRQVSELVA